MKQVFAALAHLVSSFSRSHVHALWESPSLIPINISR